MDGFSSFITSAARAHNSLYVIAVMMMDEWGSLLASQRAWPSVPLPKVLVLQPKSSSTSPAGPVAERERSVISRISLELFSCITCFASYSTNMLQLQISQCPRSPFQAHSPHATPTSSAVPHQSIRGQTPSSNKPLRHIHSQSWMTQSFQNKNQHKNIYLKIRTRAIFYYFLACKFSLCFDWSSILSRQPVSNIYMYTHMYIRIYIFQL